MKFVQHEFISSLSKYFTKEQIIVDIILSRILVKPLKFRVHSRRVVKK